METLQDILYNLTFLQMSPKSEGLSSRRCSRSIIKYTCMLTDMPLGIKVLYMCVKLSENSSRLRVIYRELNSGSLNITTAW